MALMVVPVIQNHTEYETQFTCSPKWIVCNDKYIINVNACTFIKIIEEKKYVYVLFDINKRDFRSENFKTKQEAIDWLGKILQIQIKFE